MKLKLFFLGMFAAVFLISCNNEIDGPDKDKGGEVPEGIPVYASLNFRVQNGVSTYAGVRDVGASSNEMDYESGALFIYKTDNSGSLFPEVSVYIANVGTLGGAPGNNTRVTMKATSGKKRMFVALNPGDASARMVDWGSAGDVSTVLTTTFPVLNNPLYTATTTLGWGLAPTASAVGNLVKADGLIRGLAMGEIKGDKDGIYGGTNPMLMTNWDGPNDTDNAGGTASAFNSTCYFELVPDIDSTVSNTGTSAADNYFPINVQRAFSKISLKITAATGNGSFPVDQGGVFNVFSPNVYMAGTAQTYEGQFQPWSAPGAESVGSGSETGPVWSLGNIHKETLPFQKFEGGYVRDLNYLAIDDSIANYFTAWISRYDNSRVFPASMPAYPWVRTTSGTPFLAVDSVKNVMKRANNWVDLTPSGSSDPALHDFYFAYAIENARQHPVTHDYGTYLIIGGRYNPERVLTTIQRASVTTNPPSLTYTTNYAFSIAAGDTLYYLADDGVFISGMNNLLGYFAWQKRAEPGAPADFSSFGVDTENAIASARLAKTLIAYYEGQCWYRIFVRDMNSGVTDERNVVRRNHIYAVNITEIRGPGIGDPNDILVPWKPIEELDTYVTADITILPWHMVDQEHIADLD